MRSTLSVVAIILTVIAALSVSCGTPLNEPTLVLPSPTFVSTQSNSALLEAQKSVYFVYIHFQYTYQGNPYSIIGWGSAFVVGQQKLVTCKHVAYPEKFNFDYNWYASQGDITRAAKTMYLWRPGTSYRRPDGTLNLNDALKLGTDFIIGPSLPDITKEYQTIQNGKLRTFKTHAISNNDVTLLEINENLTEKPLKLGSITDADKGKKVILIGYPRGPKSMDTYVVNPSVSVGYIRKVETYLRFTSPIIGGNSGGPAVTEDGTVVGITSFMSSEVIGFALLSERINLLLSQ